ncbi:MAG: DUF6786 family protein [Bacteroidota bacterium]
MKHFSLIFLLTLCIFSAATAQKSKATKTPPPAKRSFEYDLKFLKKHHPDLVVLSTADQKSQVAICPAYQGRVMTSTSNGLKGSSFGWINHELIASDKPTEHINAFGGEERFWLGPEGGQFSLFFKPGTQFTYDNWFVPKALDTEPFNLTEATETEAKFERSLLLSNYEGTQFNMNIKRTVKILDKKQISNLLEYNLPDGVETVGFESENTLKNMGTNAWEKKSGLLSIWILSMLNADPQATVAIPYDLGDESEIGPIVTDNYFGKVPADRLKAERGLIFFKADGKKRSKIGVSPTRAFPLAVSWDATAGVLTVMQFSKDHNDRDYVNSKWETQKEPFKGDVINVYNDGPNESGKQLGDFYELESSSPAAALKPGESMHHTNRIMHLKGSTLDLEPIARQLLGVGLAEIKN